MTATTHLLLLRHGQTAWNAEGRIQGQADPPLSDLGRAQAEALGERLRGTAVSAVYCSPALRARATAEAVARPRELPLYPLDALLELHLGAWQGESRTALGAAGAAQFRAWETDPAAAHPPGGETLEEACARVAPAIDRMLAKCAGTTFVVVTHSIVGRVIIAHLLGAGLALVPRLRLKQASVSKLRIDGGFAVLERLSDTAHLAARRPPEP